MGFRVSGGAYYGALANAGRVQGRITVAVRPQAQLRYSPATPGQLSFVDSSYTGAEATVLQFQVTRSDGASNTVAVDWAFSGLSEGLPSPSTGTISWNIGEAGPKTVSVTLGSVTAARSGVITLSNARALSTGSAPTIVGLNPASLGITDVPGVPVVSATLSVLSSTSIRITANGGTVDPSGFNEWLFQQFVGGAWTTIATQPGIGSNTFTASGLAASTQYFFRVRARANNGSLNVSASVSAQTADGTIVIPPAPAKKFFGGGWYIWLDKNDTDAEQIAVIRLYKNDLNIKGYLTSQRWKNIETAQGVYNVAKINAFLAELGAHQKLWLGLRTQLFGNSNTLPLTDGHGLCPTYLDNIDGGPAYWTGGAAWNGNLIVAAKIWEAATNTRYIAMTKWIVEYYEDDARFEGVYTGETSMDIPSGHGFTNTKLLAQFQRYAQETAGYRAQVNIGTNYLGNATLMESLIQSMRTYKTAAGGPDTLPKTGTDGRSITANNVHLGTDGSMHDYRDEVPWIAHIDGTEQGGYLGNHTLSAIFNNADYGRANMRYSHIFIYYNTPGRTNGSTTATQWAASKVFIDANQSWIATVKNPYKTAIVLSAETISSSAIQLMAEGGASDHGFVQYVFERSLNGSSGWVVIASQASGSYIDTGRGTGTQYFYRVRAQYSAGDFSAAYGAANATTAGGGTSGVTFMSGFDGIGNFQDGQTVRLLGNFGTKPLGAQPLYFFDFNSSLDTSQYSRNTLLQAALGSNIVRDSQVAPPNATFAMRKILDIGGPNSQPAGTGGAVLGNGVIVDSPYCYVWETQLWNKSGTEAQAARLALINGSYPGQGYDIYVNIKDTRLWANIGQPTNTSIGHFVHGYNSDGWDAVIGVEGDAPMGREVSMGFGPADTDFYITKNQWWVHEYLLKHSTNYNTSDGWNYYGHDGKLRGSSSSFTAINIPTTTITRPTRQTLLFGLQDERTGYRARAPGQTAITDPNFLTGDNAFVAHGVKYVDDSVKRLIVSNQANYNPNSKSTVFEIQIPIAWPGTGYVDAFLRSGRSIFSGNYLHFVDGISGVPVLRFN